MRTWTQRSLDNYRHEMLIEGSIEIDSTTASLLSPAVRVPGEFSKYRTLRRNRLVHGVRDVGYAVFKRMQVNQ
jgi:hypothetical protein